MILLQRWFTLLMIFAPLSAVFADSLQERLSKVMPGETLEIPGGVYFERLKTVRSGEPEKPITLRPVANQIVIINAGKRLELSLSPVPGMPEVFVAKVEPGLFTSKSGVWEVASRQRLKRVQSVEQCAQRLASWYYSDKTGEWFVRSSGRRPANELVYWIESTEPALKIGHSNIHVRGIHATLGEHGIYVDDKTSDVVVEKCRTFCNKKAGIHITGKRHRILENEVYHNNQHGIQLRNGVDHTVVARNRCYLNGPSNGETTDVPEPTDFGIYSRGAYNLVEENVAWGGVAKNAYRNKYGVNPTNVFRRNVVIGNLNPGEDAVFGNTFITDRPGPRAGMYLVGDREPSDDWKMADPTGLQRATNLIYPALHHDDPRFCDPHYRDYRLQSDSPYLGLGAYPGRAAVFYIDPAATGEGNTGMNVSSPLSSVEKALAVAPAGATLYLLPGVYKEPVTISSGGISGGEPLRVRAYQGSEKVKIQVPWKIVGSTGKSKELNVSSEADGVELDGFCFENAPLEIDHGAEVRIVRCRFEGSDAKVVISKGNDVTLDHDTFQNGSQGVVVKESDAVAITRCRFVGDASFEADKAEGLYSDFNQFDRFAAKVADATQNLESWQQMTRNDRWSRVGSASGSASAAGFEVAGAPVAADAPVVEIKDLHLAGLHPNGATLLWETPRGSSFSKVTLQALPDGKPVTIEPRFLFQIMGEYFDLSFLNQAFYLTDRHAALTGLRPNQEYRASVIATDYAGNRSEEKSLTFRTPATLAAPANYYISPEGSDSANGLSQSTSWRSFHHAMTKLGPGDRLILRPGTYREPLFPRVSGSPEAPIIIQAEKPGTVWIDLGESLPVGVNLMHVHHLTIEGVNLTGGAYSVGTSFILSDAKGITIRRCETDYPAKSSFESMKAGHNGLIAERAPDLLLEDNLFLCGIIKIGLASSPGTVVRHNTIAGEGNYGVVIVPGGAEETYRIEGNLFYKATLTYKTVPNIWSFGPTPKIVSDYNLFYVPPEAKGTIGKLVEVERTPTLAEWQEKSRLDLHSLAAEPKFVDPAARNFKLSADSPGKGSAPGGADIGVRY